MNKNNKSFKLKGGSGYIKQFGPLIDLSGGNIDTCTNSTTTPYHPGEQPGISIDISNPLLNYQMSTPFDGNKFGSALDTVQNNTACSLSGPGFLQQVSVGGSKKTNKKKSVKKTNKKKSVKKTNKKKSVKKTNKKKSVKKTKTNTKKTVKKTNKKKTIKKK